MEKEEYAKEIAIRFLKWREQKAWHLKYSVDELYEIFLKEEISN